MQRDGWKLDFSTSRERNLGQASLLGDIVTCTTYTPDDDPCEYEGFSNLYALFRD
jgi:type IV pilus assembly protein PilY1